jgi:hypothetical protein
MMTSSVETRKGRLYISISEIADRWRMSVRGFALVHLRGGRLYHVREGRRIRIAVDDLIAYEKAKIREARRKLRDLEALHRTPLPGQLDAPTSTTPDADH